MHLPARVLVLITLALSTGCPEDTVDVTARFTNATTHRVGSTAGKLSQQMLLGAGVAAVGEIDSLQYNIKKVRLCREAKIEYYTNEGQTHQQLTVDHDTCVAVIDRGSLSEDPLSCDRVSSSPGDWIEFTDQAELDAKLTVTRGVPVGTYKYIEVEFDALVGLQAKVPLKGRCGETTTLYSRPCGEMTCGSTCLWDPSKGDMGQWTMETCKGLIGDPFEGSKLGEKHPTTGDVWAETPFDTYHNSAGAIGAHQRYWRRCEHDMTTGPAERVYFKNENDDRAVFQLLRPMQVGAKQTERSADAVTGSNFELDLLFNLEGMLTGNATPLDFDPDANALAHRFYRGITDGFYGISFTPLALTPVARTGDESIVRHSFKARVRRATAKPLCYKNGFDSAPVVEGEGKCHPCAAAGIECTEGGSKTTATFSMKDMRPSQEFDLRIDIYRPAVSGTTEVADAYDIRAVEVAAFYDLSRPIEDAIPFFAQRATTVEKNADGTINVMFPLMATGDLPRIRNLPLSTKKLGEGGPLVVQLEFQRIVHDDPVCAQCGWDCPDVICGATNAYFEVPALLESIQAVGGTAETASPPDAGPTIDSGLPDSCTAPDAG